MALPNRTEPNRTQRPGSDVQQKKKKFLQANKLVILYLIFMSWLLILYLLFSHFPPLWFMPIQWRARLHWRHLNPKSWPRYVAIASHEQEYMCVIKTSSAQTHSTTTKKIILIVTISNKFYNIINEINIYYSVVFIYLGKIGILYVSCWK